jgi:hypothetical protein
LFEIVDLHTESKASVSKVAILMKALEIIKTISGADSRRVMAALNQPTYQDDDVLKAKIGELARDKPDVFLATYESKESYLKSDIRDAVDAGIVVHNLGNGEVSVGGMVISTMKIETSDSFVDVFARWVSSAENGQDVMNNIKLQLEKSKEQV